MTLDNGTIPLRELQRCSRWWTDTCRRLAVFYERLNSVPEIASFFSGKPQMERAMSKQVMHWQAIAGGRFEDGPPYE